MPMKAVVKGTQEIGYIEEVAAQWNRQSQCWVGEFRAYDSNKEEIDVVRTENEAFNLIIEGATV